MSNDILFEFIGTTVLMLFGSGVNANMSLKASFGYKGGWVVTTIGWGFGVFVAAFIADPYSGAHLNPALTVGLALSGKFHGSIAGYAIAQMLGAMFGVCLMFLMYKPHFDAEEGAADTKLGVFCTSPAVKSLFHNFMSEFIGTFMLMFAVLMVKGAQISGPFPVAIVIVAIGMALGGATGYAINPVRDLGPRIMHALLPIKGKRDSNWGYAWLPVVAPMCGAAAAAGFYLLLGI